VTDVYSTGFAFMALDKTTGWYQCWGDPAYGGSCAFANFQGVTDVYSTEKAFMALDKTTGNALCWGDPRFGGSCAFLDFQGVTDVYSTKHSFMALDKATGKGQCWGNPLFGGNCSGLDFQGVTDVYNTEQAFMALDKTTGKAQCWGDPDSGGRCAFLDFKGVTDVYSTSVAFMALDRAIGKGQCWGDARFGGNCANMDFLLATDVYSNKLAFMALAMTSGKAQCWGGAHSGGNCAGIKFWGVTNVYSTRVAFMAKCPANLSWSSSKGCVCRAGFHGSIIYNPHKSSHVGQCVACSGRNEYQDGLGEEHCKQCPPGHFGIPLSHPHTACDDDKCELPTRLPPKAMVAGSDQLCPRNGHMAVDGLNASRCYLYCKDPWLSSEGSSLIPFVCSPDSATTASYQGKIECVPQTVWLDDFALVGVICFLVGGSLVGCITACLAWRVHGEFCMCGVKIPKNGRLVAAGSFLLCRSMNEVQEGRELQDILGDGS